MTNIFTRDAVTEALASIVAEKGEDYIYPNYRETCVYADDEGYPSCIVGHIVDRISHEEFLALRDYEADQGPFGADEITYAIEDNGLNKDDQLKRALLIAQNIQDLGLTWGVAAEGYRRVVKGEAYLDVYDDLVPEEKR